MSKTVAVIINPESGKGRGGKSAPAVGAALHRRGIDAALILAGSAAEALEMTHKAVADGVDAVIAAGGDGTVNLALQAVAGTRTPLGIIPLGTGNDNAELIGVADGGIEGAIDAIAAFNVRDLDAARVHTADGTEAWFMGVMSSGFDSNVTERANNMTWPKGDMRYNVAILAELASFNAVPFEIDVDGRKYTDRAMLVAVGNGDSYGGGMKVCAGAEPDDGELTLTMLKEAGKLKFLRLFPRVYKGTHIDHDLVEQFHGKKVRLEAPGQIVYADGERIGPLPAEIEVVPGALRVLVPRD